MNIFDTDFHCHIIPGIDDGAENPEESVKLINMQIAQGIRHIVATPHYRMHEMSVNDFLYIRKEAFNKLLSFHQSEKMPDIMLAAEIALEHNLSELDGIEKLANARMNTLLIELPYQGYSKWMSEEIEEIGFRTGMKIIIAHLDRYIGIYCSDEYNDIFGIPDAIFQFNASVFERWKTRRLIKPLIKDDYPIVFGTDCHNTSFRKPNFHLIAKNLKGYEQNDDVSTLFDQQ